MATPASHPSGNSAQMFVPSEMPPGVMLPQAVLDKIAKGRQAFDANAAAYHGGPAGVPSSLQEPPTAQPAPPPSVQAGPIVPEPRPPEPAPVPEPEPEPEPALPAGYVAQEQYDKLDAKHRTLQGKYSAEVPQLARQVSELRREIESLRTASVADNPLPKVNKPSKLTKEEIDAYGSDLIDVVGRRAAEVVDELMSGELQSLREKLSKTEAALATVNRDVSQVATTSLEGYLSEHFPGWREQDRDPAFIAWLQEEDPTFGFPRMEGLANAKNNRRFDRVLSIFQGYQREHGTGTQPNRSEPSPAKVEDTRKVKLDTLVAPDGRRRSASVPEPQAPQAVTRADIKAYYDAKMRGAFKDRPAEIAAIEERIARALAAGLVVA